jgi:hypothetical protein
MKPLGLILAAAALLLASVGVALPAPRTAIVVHGTTAMNNFCTTMCAPQYKIWNGYLSCRYGRCVCGCVRPNNAGPPERFYEVY